MLEAEHLTGPAESGLDLVEHEENIVLCTDLAYLLEISFRGNYYSRFSLDRFNQESCCIWCYCGLERWNVIIGNDFETRGERSESNS